MTFLGMHGTGTKSFCPYCGRTNSGFSPYDGEMERLIERQKMQARMVQQLYRHKDDEYDEYDDEYDDDDDDEFEAPEDEGKYIVMDPTPEPGASIFRCRVCGEKFQVKADKAFCYFCGKEDTEKIEEK